MIKVARSSVKPSARWFGRAKMKTAKLKEEFFDIPFADRIQKSPNFDHFMWKAIEPFLRKLFNDKCAYCETPIADSMGAIDAFRPRIGAIGLDRTQNSPDHYWWLVYEWENLYLACPDCNFNKGSKFPVEKERGKLEASLSTLRRTEKALLLDPCVDDPDAHLAFGDNGMVSPKSKKGGVTIEVLNLNRPKLVGTRSYEIKKARGEVIALTSIGQFSTSALEKLLAPSHPYAAARGQALHRFVREELKDFGINFGKKEQETTLKQVKKASRFTSSVKQHSLDEQFIKEQELKESLPVGGGASDEFLYSKTQYITKIVIHNFRIVEDMTLEFAQPQVTPEPTQQQQNIAPESSEPQKKKPWMILLGENGVGKSSILKAVALALMGKEKHKALKLRPEKFLTHGRDEGFIEVHLTGYTKPFRLDFKRGDKEFQTNGNKLHTLFFCYGGTRLLPTGRRRRPESTDDYARINNLFDPFLPLIQAESWLLGLDDKKFGFSAKAVKKLLMSDEANTLVREPPDKPREVFLEFETRKSRDTLERLSDGYQSVIALAADILEIMLKHYDEVEDSEGIVLIDEIDVHLHPRWKVEIVNLLRAVFPRVQFLVTTHDPLCLLGTLPGEVHVLYRPPDSNQVSVKQVDVPPGTTADQVLTGFWFGLRSTLDDDTLALLDKHRRLLREKVPETNEERHNLEVELRKRLGTFADTSVDRMAQSVAAEVIQGDVSKLGAEDRDAMRQNIRQKLLQMIKEKKEKGG